MPQNLQAGFGDIEAPSVEVAGDANPGSCISLKSVETVVVSWLRGRGDKSPETGTFDALVSSICETIARIAATTTMTPAKNQAPSESKTKAINATGNAKRRATSMIVLGNTIARTAWVVLFDAAIDSFRSSTISSCSSDSISTSLPLNSQPKSFADYPQLTRIPRP